MYESIPAGVSKAYLELAGGDHLCVETGNGNKAIQGKYAVAWMKRFLDEDVRYSPYLCGAPHTEDLGRADAVSGYRETCPYWSDVDRPRRLDGVTVAPPWSVRSSRMTS